MQIKYMQLGMVCTNCYIFWADGSDQCAVVDPGDDGQQVASLIQGLKLTPVAILLTHSHFDHVLGVPDLLAAYPDLPVYITETDYPEARDGGQFGYKMGPVESVQFYDEGSTVHVGNLAVDVLRTPGHTPGSVTLKVEDVLFTGDTLFNGSCGRTDFPGGSFADMQRSLKRLSDLPGNYRVYPGHEGSTTLDYERKYNPFMQRL